MAGLRAPKLDLPANPLPHLRIGRPGGLPRLRHAPPPPAPPGAPARTPSGAPAPAPAPAAAPVVHIHQEVAPVQQPTRSEPRPSRASAAREHLRAVMGPQIAHRTEGMDAEGMRLLQTHTRAHGRAAMREYHGAGKERLKQLIADAKGQRQGPGQAAEAPRGPTPDQQAKRAQQYQGIDATMRGLRGGSGGRGGSGTPGGQP